MSPEKIELAQKLFTEATGELPEGDWSGIPEKDLDELTRSLQAILEVEALMRQPGLSLT